MEHIVNFFKRTTPTTPQSVSFSKERMIEMFKLQHDKDFTNLIPIDSIGGSVIKDDGLLHYVDKGTRTIYSFDKTRGEWRGRNECRTNIHFDTHSFQARQFNGVMK